jgi:hypothetical protein
LVWHEVGAKVGAFSIILSGERAHASRSREEQIGRPEWEAGAE